MNDNISDLIRGERTSVLRVVLLHFFAAGANQIFPIALGALINMVQTSGSNANREFTAWVFAAMLFGVVARFFLYRSAIYQSSMLGLRLVHKVRVVSFGSALRLSTESHRRYEHGELAAVQSSDTAAIGTFLEDAAERLVGHVMTVIVVAVSILFLWPSALIPILAVLVIVTFVSRMLRPRARAAVLFHKESQSLTIGRFSEHLAGKAAFKDDESRLWAKYRFRDASSLSVGAHVTSQRVTMAAVLMIRLGGTAALIAIVATNLEDVSSGSMLVGTLLTLVILTRRFFEPIQSLLQYENGFTRASMSLDTLCTLARASRDDQDIRQPSSVRRLEVRGVTFLYAEKVVLNGIFLELTRGETCVINGPSGGGKSTFARILAGVDDSAGGSVVFDGVAMTSADLRQMVHLTPQSPSAFSGSVLENIRLFRSDISEDDVVRVATLMDIDAEIRRMRAGYRTPISEVSDRMFRLLVLARAVLADTPVVIFDEHTAGRDVAESKQINLIIERFCRDRICIIFSHDQSALRADRFFQLVDGALDSVGPWIN